MVEIKQRKITINGREFGVAEAGPEGKLVLLVHGFPESWYSWRHTIPALADAGYHAVALHMRGYGDSYKPADLDKYLITELAGDCVGAVAALGYKTATIVGHDWGSGVAAQAAIMRDDVFTSMCLMSVPFLPPSFFGPIPDGVTIDDVWKAAAAGRNYYRLYFQSPEVEKEIEADMRTFVLGFMYLISGEAVRDGVLKEPCDGHWPGDKSLMEYLKSIVPAKLPAWLTEEDLEVYVNELKKSGIRGGLNYYRNMGRAFNCLAPFVGKVYDRPFCYIGSWGDTIAHNTPDYIDTMKKALPQIKALEMIDDCGHWIQQEKAKEVNEILIKFLNSLA
ncbi:epoxide hydrolase [Hyaloraphidium curvatum]|nr:epoxide hydrolase [Hyaloraphidium curvatum]